MWYGSFSLSVSGQNTLLKIDSTLCSESHFSNVTKPEGFCYHLLLLLFFTFRIRKWMCTFMRENFLAVKRDFRVTGSKMFKPGRIIVIIQPVLFNVHATELLLEAGLKQTFWKIFHLFLNIQVILVPSVSLLPYWTVCVFNYPCSLDVTGLYFSLFLLLATVSCCVFCLQD